MDRIGPKRVLRWYHREWREHLGLTQDQVAARMDTNKGQVPKLEKGNVPGGQRMNEDWVLRYAEAFGIEPADLMRDPKAPDLNQLLRDASPAQKEQATAVVIALLKTG